MEMIINQIEKEYGPLSSDCKNEIIKHIHFLTFKKGEIIVREGQYSDKIYFIVEGAARAYYLVDGKDVSDYFAFENEFISSIISFFGHQPSPHYIELVQDSIVIEVSRKSFDTLSKRFHDFEHLIRIVVTKVMLQQQERISSILFQSAEQRYKHILSIRPDIIQRVPLKHIASYLGMTLETLSRVRNPKT